MQEKLSVYQERICKLRADGHRDHTIAKLTCRSVGTVKNDFLKIRKLLSVPSDEEIFRISWEVYLRKKEFPSEND